jgi:hypothetical protein
VALGIGGLAGCLNCIRSFILFGKIRMIKLLLFKNCFEISQPPITNTSTLRHGMYVCTYQVRTGALGNTQYATTKIPLKGMPSKCL